MPAAANARNAAGASSLRRRHVEFALEREDVALEPRQQLRASAQPGVGQLRQVSVEIDQPGHDEPRPQVDHVIGVVLRVERLDAGYQAVLGDLDKPVGQEARLPRVERRQHARPDPERRRNGQWRTHRGILGVPGKRPSRIKL